MHARVYVPEGCGALRLYARFTTPEAVERLAAGDDRPPLEGLTLVRRVTLPWESIRRVRVWREGATLLFFHPRYWQVLAMRCPLADLPLAEEYVRKKLKRFKRVKVLPPLPRKQLEKPRSRVHQRRKCRMRIRRYEPDDLAQITALFYDTVHAVNAADYSPEQLDAWADGAPDRDRWNRFPAGAPFAGGGGGRGTLSWASGISTRTGYLDRLYVHRDRQGQGIATALCDRLERAVDAPVLTTHASITARPFFEARGYRVIREQRVERHGVRMTNYVMEKRRQA